MDLVAVCARAPVATVAAAFALGLVVEPGPPSTVASAIGPHPAVSTGDSELRAAPVRTTFAASWHRICELVTDGTVRCLGNNEFGELGDGTHAARRTWTQVDDLRGVVQLALGGEHTCALLRDTTVRCWGANPFGQLGDGTRLERTRPVAVRGLSGVVEIAAGAFHSCARLRGGDVVCWGGNLGGMPIEFDPDTAYRALPLRVEAAFGATSLVLGHEHGYAMLENHRTVEWRYPERASKTIAELRDAAQLAAGWSHDCMLTRDARVRCWGSNSYGQLGADTAYSPEEAKPVENLSAVTQIALGRDHSCARTSDGGVVCWGANEAGQVGGTRTEVAGPTRVAGVRGAQRVVCGWDFSCAITDEGRTQCWGSHDFVPSRPDEKPATR